MRRKKDPMMLNLEVVSYAAGGKSLAKKDGKVIFIEGAVPGDVVDVQLHKNKKDWAEGVVHRFHQFSAERVKPFCKHFGVCGGCKWQMLPYEKQVFYKQSEVEQHLKRIGKISLPPLQNIAAASETTHYRNKLEFTFSSKKYFTKEEIAALNLPEGEKLGLPSIPALGFHVPGAFDKVIDIDECFLQQEPSNHIRNQLRSFVLEKGFSFYDIRNHVGLMRNLMIRNCTTGELMVNVVFGENIQEQILEVMNFMKSTFPEITSLYYTVNTKFNDSIFDQTPILFNGNAYAIEKLAHWKFKISPKSFFQTNTKQAEILYQITKDFAELTGKETVYDLYCGTGSIGIFVSDHAKKVIGVELIDEAIRDAKENVVLNNIQNASFFTGDVATLCTDNFFDTHGRPDVIITDPPRAGMHEKLVDQILKMEAPVVVYVSCNPATQARDLNLLAEKYDVTVVRPVDMFPHTHHIENVVQLKLKSH
ncbi:MAG: 23S rRNA (uracil(1939)-C(5))-methyltransferase RlmD [Chitinophagia bacterium]|nr:23S rRNA (uracil(1939)-C(5))-methyltransferase RlmD [Chitinophagia bacterium]